MDLNAVLTLVLVGVIPLLILGVVLLIAASVFRMIRGSARGVVYPLALVGFPLAFYDRVKRHRRRVAISSVPAIMLAVFALSNLSPHASLAAPAAIALAPSDGNVSVMTGVPVTMIATGLTASTTYRIYIADSLHKIVDTGSAETSKTFTILFYTDGKYNVSIRDTTGVTFHDSLLMYATNPFGDLLYTIIPLLLGAGAIVILVGGFALILGAIRARS